MAINKIVDLPALTKKRIELVIKTQKQENSTYIKKLEKILMSMRGYIFVMPPPGTPVILLISGGLDTIVLADILMSQYKLRVFPLHVSHGEKRIKKEERAVKYFSRYYLKKYPNLYNEPLIIKSYIPPKKISETIISHSEIVIDEKTGQKRGLSFLTYGLAGEAAQYAQYLELKHRIKVKTIFFGITFGDGKGYPHQTLSALRSITVDVCMQTKDLSWQFTSLAVEKELGFFFDKDTLIKYASDNKIPTELTWSCFFSKIFHCGKCTACAYRKYPFNLTKIYDPTLYLTDHKKTMITKILRRIFSLKPIW